MHKYRLAIFDMDGTILNTLDDLYEAVNYILKKYNFPTRTKEEVRLSVGNGLLTLLKRTVPYGTKDETIQEMFLEFVPYYKSHSIVLTKPYDGICDTIQALRKEGIITAMITNKAHTAAQGLVKMFFNGLFDLAIGEQAGIPLKPAPDSIYYVMNHFHCSKEDTVYIGDSEVDLETAHNAGIHSISVTWGFRTKEELLPHNVDVFCESPYDLPQHI